jgi:hypothetical protein
MSEQDLPKHRIVIIFAACLLVGLLVGFIGPWLTAGLVALTFAGTLAVRYIAVSSNRLDSPDRD